MMRQKLGTLAVSTLLLAAGGAFAQAAVPTTVSAATHADAASPAHAGFVKTVQGTVRLVGPTGGKRPHKVGEAVGSANRIETEADSGASVVLRDGTVLVLGPSSSLDLKQFSFNATTQEGGMFVSLVRGSLRMITGLLGKTPESVRIETQTATIGIRGTDFIVSARDSI